MTGGDQTGIFHAMNDINTAFTGDIPQYYDRHLGPMFFECCAADLATRAIREPAAQVLEIAAGTGILTRMLRDRLPAAAQLVATDLNPDMLTHAQRKFATHEDIRFEPANAQQLPFPDAHFDLALCQFGIMFCHDKRQAFAEARRVLREGGRILFSTWNALEDNPLPATVNRVLDEIFAGNAPAFLNVPFSYHTRDEILTDARAAGFDPVELIQLDGYCEIADAIDAARGFVQGSPLQLEIAQRGDIDLEQVIERVAEGIAARFGERDTRAPMRWMVVEAINPATKY